MKSHLILLLIVAMFFVVTKSEDEEYYTTEQPINEEDVITTTTENALLRKGPEEYGKREQLDPNLTGLENFAILYLPKNFNYSNIIEAYREVKDGIRYDLLVNATDEKNVTILCNLVIHEKSWFVTPWDERLRILEKSNCSSQTEIKNFNENFSVDQAHIDLTYENNTIFNPENKKISKGTSLDDIEGMIIESKIEKQTQNLIQNSNSKNENDETTVISIIETTAISQTEVENSAADLSVRNDNNEVKIQGNLNNANQDSSQHLNTEYTTEAPVIPTNLHQTGNREKLKSNLVGLQNMALVYLPRQLTYSKIIEAYREVINGVRYDILIQANRNDNTEIICDIQVQEKPWLLTPWGDKVRVLEKSNCSDLTEIMNINDRNHLDQATLDEKYPNNTLFNPTVQHVSDGLLDQIESMILQPKNLKKQTKINDNNNIDNNNKHVNNDNNNNYNSNIRNNNYNVRHNNNERNINYNTNHNNYNDNNYNNHDNGNNHQINNDYNVNTRNHNEFRRFLHNPITTSTEYSPIE